MVRLEELPWEDHPVSVPYYGFFSQVGRVHLWTNATRSLFWIDGRAGGTDEMYRPDLVWEDLGVLEAQAVLYHLLGTPDAT